MAELETEEWGAPVYHALSEPFLLWGVPPMFCFFNALGAIAVAIVCVMLSAFQVAFTVVAVGGLAHGAAVIGTQIEPRWWSMWREYLRYARQYKA